MRKLLLTLLIILFTTGCTSSSDSESERVAKYKEYIQTVQDNNGAQSQNIPFQYALDVTSTKSKEYMYTITIDHPMIAMYDIEAIIVDMDKVGGDEMMPNLGIIDDEDAIYHMIPFQVNAKRGFHKGIQLNGFTKAYNFNLRVLVTWKDYAKLNTSKAFFSFSYHDSETKQDDKTKTTGDKTS